MAGKLRRRWQRRRWDVFLASDILTMSTWTELQHALGLGTRLYVLEVAILGVPVDHVRELLHIFRLLQIRRNVRVVVYSIIHLFLPFKQILASSHLLEEFLCVQEIWLVVMFMRERGDLVF